MKRFAKTLDELAARYQRSERSIRNWIEEGAPPKLKGRFVLKDWDEWVGKYKTSDGGSKVGLQTQELVEIVRRLKRQNEVDEGKYLATEDVQAAIEQLTGRIRLELLRLRKTIGAALGIEAEKKAEDIIQSILDSLKENPLG